MNRPQRPDTARCPSLPLSGLHSHPVEGGGNVRVGPTSRHGSHDCKGSFRCTLAMFAGVGFADAELGMLATFPVDRQKDFALLFINISDDIGHKSAKELLTATHIDIRCAPGGLQVGGNAGEIGSWYCMFDLSALG
jgi:hypothetical protein